MKCPNCGLVNKSKVTNSRQKRMTTKRWRTCLECNTRFITYEVTSEEFDKYMHQETKRFSEGEIITMIMLREKGLKHGEIALLLGRSKQSVDMKMFKLLTNEEYFLVLDEIERMGYLKNVESCV
jgi:transcriptional regulator NrdR family protein